MIRLRREDPSNYSAAFIVETGTTMRMPIDPAKPIGELSWPEFLDVTLGTKCDANCPFCYASATKAGRNFVGVVDKIQALWGPLPQAQRPFQVAIGGHGEPLEHPSIIRVLEAFRRLNIVPNYTTNGRYWWRHGIMSGTREFAGGVAVSCHPHMENEWVRAVNEYLKAGVKLDLHVVIGNAASVVRFNRIYDAWADKVGHIVLLPLVPVGRAANMKYGPDTDALLESFKGKSWSKLAFGAGFWDWLGTRKDIPAILYEPHTLSKYVFLDDPIKVFNNSHEMNLLMTVRPGSVMPPVQLQSQAAVL